MDLVLNILSFGMKPLYERQRRFHDLIIDFRSRFANPGRANKVQADIEELYEKLNNFDFSFVLFENYYRQYIENLNRLRPNLEGNELDLNFIRIALAENKWKPTKPLSVFRHSLKYDYKLTAKPFVSYQKNQHQKKLNSPGVVLEKRANLKSSQKWTRVPIRTDQNSKSKSL